LLPVFRDGGVQVQRPEHFLWRFLALRHVLRKREQRRRAVSANRGKTRLRDLPLRRTEDVVAERSLTVKQSSDGKLDGVHPALNLRLQNLPVHLLNLRETEPLHSEMIQRLINDRFSHYDVNLDTLFAVSRGNHTLRNGFQIRHGDSGYRATGEAELVLR